MRGRACEFESFLNSLRQTNLWYEEGNAKKSTLSTVLVSVAATTTALAQKHQFISDVSRVLLRQHNTPFYRRLAAEHRRAEAKHCDARRPPDGTETEGCFASKPLVLKP